MKKLLGKSKYYILIAFISSTASAATFTDPSKITFIGVYGPGNIGVQLENSNIKNPANCVETTSATKLFKIVDDTDHGKNVYSLALASKASGANVQLIVNESSCTGVGTEGWAIINGIKSY